MWGSKRGPVQNFSFVAPAQESDGLDFIWINVESYIWKMIPDNCFKNTSFAFPVQYASLYRDGILVDGHEKTELEPRMWTIYDFQPG